MLSITLRVGQGVTIGKDIHITNLSDKGIRIGIDAPKQIQVLRDNAKKRTPPTKTKE